MLGKFKINILLINISLFTAQAKWIVPRVRGASSFLFPQMGSPIWTRHYESKIHLFLQWSKTDRVVAHPTARSGMDPLHFPALYQRRCHSPGRPVPGIAAPGLAQLPPHTSPKYRWSLQPAQPRLAVGAWKGKAAGLPNKCIYYSLDCKNGQTIFPNLRGQTHSQPHSSKPEEMGGTRTKNTTDFSVNVGTTRRTAK